MKKKIKLIALDLDGTITQHRSPLTSETHNFLEFLAGNYKLVMVCAGNCNRVRKQLGVDFIDIIGNYGLEFLPASSEEVTSLVLPAKFNASKALITNKIDRLRGDFGFTEFCGNSVEFHDSGVVTFPILGTTAKIQDKLAFDPKRSIRRLIYDEVIQAFPEYNVFIGGSSSFDLVPKPFDKLFAIDRYLNENGLDQQDVLYFGDDFGIGGNDSPIIDSSIPYFEIDNYKEFQANVLAVL